MFKVKRKKPHPSCVIYRGKCSCGEEYIGETERNVEKRWSEHINPTEKTEPARHLSNNIGHLFAWEIPMPAPKDKRTCKNLEVFFIVVQKPSLNEQVKSSVLHLFRNSITWGTFLMILMTFYFIFYWFYSNTCILLCK